jgi:hypothetical protein
MYLHKISFISFTLKILHRQENKIVAVAVKKKKVFFSLEKFFFYSQNFVYARPYIDGIPAHSKQQIAVYGHSGQNAKCYLKRKEKIKAKLIKICLTIIFRSSLQVKGQKV